MGEETKTLQLKIDALASEIRVLKKTIGDRDKHVKQLQEDLADMSKFKPMFEEKDYRCSDLEEEVKRRTLDLSDKDLTMQALTAKRDSLETQVEELTVFKWRTMHLTVENQRLHDVIESYESMLGEQRSQVHDIVTNLTKLTCEKYLEVLRLLDEIAQLKKIISDREKDRRKQLQLRIVQALANTLKSERASVFMKWKTEAEHEPAVLGSEYRS